MLDPMTVRVRLLTRELLEAIYAEYNDANDSSLIDTVSKMSDEKFMNMFKEKMIRAKLSFTTFIVNEV